jgi:hypothetical protein
MVAYYLVCAGLAKVWRKARICGDEVINVIGYIWDKVINFVRDSDVLKSGEILGTVPLEIVRITHS